MLLIAVTIVRLLALLPGEAGTDALGVIKASGVISLGTVPPLLPEFDRKSEGAGSEGIFLRSVWEPVPDSLSELWSVRLSEKPKASWESERDRNGANLEPAFG